MMLGLLGDTVIELDHFTGPTERTDQERSRLVRHETVRGAPVVQDLGNDARTQTLTFFLDETYCDVEAEIDRLRGARQARSLLGLLLGTRNLHLGRYTLEEIEIITKKTTRRGRIVRAEVTVELLEAGTSIASALGGIASDVATALGNPFLRR